MIDAEGIEVDENDLDRAAGETDAEQTAVTSTSPVRLVRGAFGRLAAFPKQNPFKTNIILATLKASFADLLVQVSEGQDEIDWARNAVFIAWGFAYQGGFQWFLYVSVFTRLWPDANRFADLPCAEKAQDGRGVRDVFMQTLMDVMVHFPFIYFPVFYTFKELIQSTETVWVMDTVTSALTKYWNNILEDNVTVLIVIVPSDLLAFAVPI